MLCIALYQGVFFESCHNLTMVTKDKLDKNAIHNKERKKHSRSGPGNRNMFHVHR